MTVENRPKIEAIDPNAEVGALTRAFVWPFQKLGPWVMFASEFSDLSDRRYMSREHCYLYLFRRVAEARNSRRRNNHLPGRVYNWLTGSAGEYVDATGAVMAMVMDTLRYDRPKGFQYAGTYRVRIDVAEELVSEFTELMKNQGMLK